MNSNSAANLIPWAGLAIVLIGFAIEVIPMFKNRLVRPLSGVVGFGVLAYGERVNGISLWFLIGTSVLGIWIILMTFYYAFPALKGKLQLKSFRLTDRQISGFNRLGFSVLIGLTMEPVS